MKLNSNLVLCVDDEAVGLHVRKILLERGVKVDGALHFPSADELGAELERFLAEQQGKSD